MTLNVVPMQVHGQLLKFCYADGKRSFASSDKRVCFKFDSLIRALAIVTDSSYEATLDLVSLDLPINHLFFRGVPRAATEKLLEYFGYVKAPQPTAAMSLQAVFDLMQPHDSVMLEVDGFDVVPFIDGVLYDLKDWRHDPSRKVTGFWFRQREVEILPVTISGHVTNPKNEVVEEFTQSDCLPREPAELAGYAFYALGLNRSWELDHKGSCVLNVRMAVKLPSSRASLVVQTAKLRCTPYYVRFLRNGSGEEHARAHSEQVASIEKGTTSDASRWLDAYDVLYDVGRDGILWIENKFGYRPLSGEIFGTPQRKVRFARGFKALRRRLRVLGLIKSSLI